MAVWIAFKVLIWLSVYILSIFVCRLFKSAFQTSCSINCTNCFEVSIQSAVPPLSMFELNQFDIIVSTCYSISSTHIFSLSEFNQWHFLSRAFDLINRTFCCSLWVITVICPLSISLFNQKYAISQSLNSISFISFF